jgi:hypothetical protein
MKAFELAAGLAAIPGVVLAHLDRQRHRGVERVELDHMGTEQSLRCSC